MSEVALQERVERTARRYLEDVQGFDVVADLDGEANRIRGFVTRGEDGDFRFVYLSYRTSGELERWSAGVEFDDVREQFERDLVSFCKESEEVIEGRVCYAEIRLLALGGNRAVLKFITAEPACISEVC